MARQPGAAHLARLCRRVAREFSLDLEGLTVLTEAATGPFAATAPLAAFCGARVFAMAKANRFGPAKKSVFETRTVAHALRIREKIHYAFRLPPHRWKEIDIVTNSGNLRPIRRAHLQKLPSTAVLSLMVEPWEVRSKDIDLRAAKSLNVTVAGVNERGRKVAVFAYLGPLLKKILRENRIRIRKKRVLLLSTVEFRPYLVRAIREAGGSMTTKPERCNLTVVATGPEHLVSGKSLHRLPKDSLVIQLWGNVPRQHVKHVRWLPKKPPPSGHMGYLLSDLGPQPVIRLLAGGLKVGELLARARHQGLSPSLSVRHAVHAGFALA